MTSFIVGIYEFLKQHRLLRNLSLLIVTVCFGVLVLQQTYKEDISDFLPLNNKYQQALNVYQDISGADQIITIFQFNDSTQADPDSMIVAIADFEQRLLSLDSLGISDNLTTQIDNEKFTQIADFVYSNIPYFLTDTDYDRIDSLLASEQYIDKQIAADKQLLMFPISGLFAENFQRDPLNLFTPVVSRLQGSQPSVNYELYDGYIFSDDMNRAFATMSSPFGASETEHNSELLQVLQEKAKETMTSRYVKPLLHSLKTYYKAITGLDPEVLHMDANTNITIDEAGLQRDAELFSTGYRDLFGIALRVAFADAMYTEEIPFLIMDDPFVNLDDSKLKNVREFLELLAEKYQILYFTCSTAR